MNNALRENWRIVWCKNVCALLTLRSLKKTVFRAQSTCENKFWSNTLHINSKRSTSHWLYDWLWSSENSCDCHSRSSTDWTNSRIIGDTLGKFKLFEFFQYCFLLIGCIIVIGVLKKKLILNFCIKKICFWFLFCKI